MSKTKIVISFLIGAACGFLASYKYNQKKYKKLADEDIKSVRETFEKEKKKYLSSNKKKTNDVKSDHLGWTEDDKKGITKDELSDKYQKIIKDNKYNEKVEEKRVDDMNDYDDPYVISPDEFNIDDSYDVISLTYYADGVVANEQGEPLDDSEIDELIGEESLEHFGEYEDDCVYVRNERLKTNFEILADQSNYYPDEEVESDE